MALKVVTGSSHIAFEICLAEGRLVPPIAFLVSVAPYSAGISLVKAILVAPHSAFVLAILLLVPSIVRYIGWVLTGLGEFLLLASNRPGIPSDDCVCAKAEIEMLRNKRMAVFLKIKLDFIGCFL